MGHQGSASFQGLAWWAHRAKTRGVNTAFLSDWLHLPSGRGHNGKDVT
jgi:hypothetical protein